MTAQHPSADSHAAHNLRLIPHPYLAQLDPGAEDAGQILHQLPEVDAPVRGKIKQHFIIVKCILRVNQLHLQVVLLDLLLADFNRLLLLLAVLLLHRLILRRGHADYRLYGGDNL